MATYPNVNAANQYARDIVGGKILACQLTILACQRHLDDLERAKDPHWPYRFDKNKAERFLRFAQKMPHTSGEWARRKLRIEFEAWQKFALGVPFGWVHKKTGLRRFSEIYIEVPRKNGKSAIAAAVGNYMFCADGEHGAEVYCGATTEKQAWKVFSPALQMVKKLPALRQKFSIKPWAKKMTRPDGSVFAPVIGDPGDGDSPSCAIIDEYHEHTTDALYTTMTTGTQTEKDIRSQADSLTRLNTSLKQQATRGANVLPDGSFESYAVGDVLSNARAVITSEAAHSGTKSLRVTRSTEYNPNATDNNDTHIFSGMQVRDNAVYYVEAWVKLPAGSTADPTVYMVLGFSFQDSANGWSWPGLNVKVSELSVDNWTKVSGYLTNNRTALKQAMVRISIPNTPKVRLGDAFLIDDLIITDVTGRVSQVENTITSQSQSITSLTSTINTIRTQGANPWVDGTFESYSDGQVLGGNGTAVVVASQKFTGNKSLQVSRGANNNGNSDKQLGSWQSVREDAKFRFEFWAMMPADQAPSSGWTTLVGINSLNAAGQNSWQSAVTVSEAALGARDKWVKFKGIASNNGGGRTRAVVWISTRGASGSGTPGYSLYIDDLVITDVTDAKAAQDASDATASAVSGLTARVTDAEGKITAQAQQQTALATKVDNANSRVDNMAKTLSDSQSTQASLNTSLQSQIDAQAAANIKNQTTLDNTIKSVASITSTQQTHATALEALATQQTTLTSSVGDLSASVQNTAKTVADVNGTVSSLWSMKVETVNGKNVGAGITLGSNGETSDMILYADRFSLFNRNNATAVPVMVAEGNELYIDTARIKNSSLTSTKIADGSITNAKIGNEIRSNDFVDGSRGWRIAKDGSSQFNNVIVRGAVYATDGWFQGTVYANHIEGDIGSFAINIAQHRTRKVPKATWQWFELARFRRQNFDQVINIRGGLLQTDSITIDGGAKLRAGMSYAPGADGGLNPGYLSYAMLLRGTGATSGGGSMELGIELMYETGGATRLLTAQESMNVDNMSFVVPAGTGDAVLRYGCYLDRNGQMVLTILSRFDAFAARNNNVIRGSST